MSDSPCTGCRSTTNGRLFYVYVNHYVGDDLVKRRARLCRECVGDLLPPILEGADYEENRQWIQVELRRVPLRTPTQSVPAVEKTLTDAPNIATFMKSVG